MQPRMLANAAALGPAKFAGSYSVHLLADRNHPLSFAQLPWRPAAGEGRHWGGGDSRGPGWRAGALLHLGCVLVRVLFCACRQGAGGVTSHPAQNERHALRVSHTCECSPGVTDHLAQDERHALAITRDIVSTLGPASDGGGERSQHR